MRIDLTKAKWELRGYRPNYWHQRRSIDHQGHYQPQWGPIAAIVPGSAQTALRDAGILPDWNVGTNSLLCEWAEHYEWEFRTKLKPVKVNEGERVVLHCEGLDYSGWIGIDNKIVAEFKGALIRHDFDLTDALADGKPHYLSIVFAQAPAEQGQVGYTSQSKYFKPRYSYSWDWCPRFVPVGIWDRLWLEVGRPGVRVKKILTSLAEDLKTGTVSVFVENPQQGKLRVAVRKGPNEIWSIEQHVSAGEQTLMLKDLSVEPWWPNGVGKQPLYDVIVTDEQGEQVHRATVGFKRVRWLQNPGIAPHARPYLCEVNGQQIFLQGVNWTPIRMDYHHIPRDQYVKRINLYKEMGCNVLRVWGGAYLEREEFYDLCDRAGLLVWQEFPLSSSGIDNCAPEDPQAIADLSDIARDYIHRRAHHACKLLWCGGNELLTMVKDGKEFPLTEAHPALATLKTIVVHEDPETRFLPTSPSGPVFYAQPENVGTGTGLHHHVHGPWNHQGPFATAEEYWRKDDASFRSETGMPGASSYALIKKYAGGISAWPPTAENPLWSHTSLWWLPRVLYKKELKGLKGETALKKFCQVSQEFQSKILELAAGSCKSRFPTCSGFIVWMGHDAFPTQCNTSIIDFEGNPKRAYHTLAKIFRSPVTSQS